MPTLRRAPALQPAQSARDVARPPRRPATPKQEHAARQVHAPAPRRQPNLRTRLHLGPPDQRRAAYGPHRPQPRPGGSRVHRAPEPPGTRRASCDARTRQARLLRKRLRNATRPAPGSSTAPDGGPCGSPAPSSARRLRAPASQHRRRRRLRPRLPRGGAAALSCGARPGGRLRPARLQPANRCRPTRGRSPDVRQSRCANRHPPPRATPAQQRLPGPDGAPAPRAGLRPSERQPPSVGPWRWPSRHDAPPNRTPSRLPEALELP